MSYEHTPYLTTTSTLVFLILLLLFTGPVATGQSTREVTFTSEDGVVLSADLLLPDTDSLCPLVIFVHGSGRSPRTNPVAQAYADEFVNRDIAFLNPDKRGSGESGGDWHTASFADLARDVHAAISFARDVKEIDQRRITLFGFSQGSYIVSVAGADPRVARVISMSGSVVSLHQQIRNEVRMMASREGLEREAINAIDSLNALAFAYAYAVDAANPTEIPGDTGSVSRMWRAYRQYRDTLSRRAYGANESVAGFPTEANDPKFEFLSRVGSFDPLDHWPAVTVPTLFLYGAQDENVDVTQSVRLISEQLTGPGRDATLLVFGQSGHAFIRDDQLDFMARWIAADE